MSKKLKEMGKKTNNAILNMNEDELEQLLEEELSKSDVEIDSHLVDKILEALNAPEPSPDQVVTSWNVIKNRLRQMDDRSIL